MVKVIFWPLVFLSHKKPGRYPFLQSSPQDMPSKHSELIFLHFGFQTQKDTGNNLFPVTASSGANISLIRSKTEN